MVSSITYAFTEFLFAFAVPGGDDAAAKVVAALATLLKPIRP